MSFLRHKEIYRPILRAEGGLAAAPINHRFDEFPTSYSLTSCSPALLVSASLALGSMIDLSPAGNDLPANSNLSLVSVFHGRGALHSVPFSRFRQPRFGATKIHVAPTPSHESSDRRHVTSTMILVSHFSCPKGR